MATPSPNRSPARSLERAPDRPGRSFDLSVAGEINLDLILSGLPADMPLERELLASGFAVTLGSSSAITAHNLASLGSRVGFVTQVGPDDFGRLALARLGESGVDLSRTLHSATPTGVTLLLPHGRERHILTYPGTMAEMRADALPFAYLADARHFHLASLFLQKGLHAGLPRLLADLRAAGLTVSLDTNDDPDDGWSGILDDVLPLIDILLPSESELLRIAHAASLTDALARLGPQIPLIVVKCGPRGALVQHGSVRQEIPAAPVTPVDTIGAGDSFNAGFLHAWLAGSSPAEAARFGAVTGALSTLSSGGTESFRNHALRDRFLALHTPPA